jgi:hypothetical protein
MNAWAAPAAAAAPAGKEEEEGLVSVADVVSPGKEANEDAIAQRNFDERETERRKKNGNEAFFFFFRLF